MGQVGTAEQVDKKQPFRGWLVVAGLTMMFGAATGLFFNCNGVFMAPVSQALGVTRGAFSFYTTIGSFVGMGAMVLYGELYRRHPQRIHALMLASCVVCCACVLGYSFATRVWHFYILSACYGLMQANVSGLSLTTIINNWFIEKKGLATGIAFAGSGLVAAVMTPVAARVVATYGWRWGYRLLAAVGLGMMLTAILLLIRVSPIPLGQKPLGALPQTERDGEPGPVTYTGITRARALRTPAFYLLALAYIFIGMCGQGTLPHLIAYLTSVGFEPTRAASVQSMVMVLMIAGKIGMGALFDRIGPIKSSMVTGFLIFGSVSGLAFVQAAPWVVIFFTLVYGLGGSSVMTVPYSYLVSENFGTREYAAIYSTCNTMSGLVSAFGSPVAGALYDRAGDYSLVWPTFMVFAAIGSALLVTSAVLSRKNGYKQA